MHDKPQSEVEPKRNKTHLLIYVLLFGIICLLAIYIEERRNNVQLKNEIEALKNNFNDIQAKLYSLKREKPRPVAFMAQLSSNMDVEPLGEVHRPIIFDQVSVNVGDSYNKYTGVFTAPETVVYHFNLDVSSPPPGPPTHHLHIHILKNGQQIGYTFLDDHRHYWLRRATAVTVQLDVGDTVQAVVVLSSGGKANTVAGCCFHTHFSGFLVSNV